MSSVDEFRTICRSRSDGDWGLLATAAGDEAAVHACAARLQRDALAQGVEGISVSPTRVALSVEALACNDSAQLRAISHDWPAPDSLDRDKFTDAFYIEAWESSLRHLAKHDLEVDDGFGGNALRQEVECLVLPSSYEPFSFLAMIDQFESRFVSMEEIRATSLRPMVESSLIASDLARCLGIEREQTNGSTIIQKAPLLLLRLLRQRSAVLSDSAREWLIEIASQLNTWSPIEQALYAEICIEANLPSLQVVATELMNRISSSDDPSEILFPAFVLIGDDWQTP